MDLALNNLQRLICHKNSTSQTNYSDFLWPMNTELFFYQAAVDKCQQFTAVCCICHSPCYRTIEEYDNKGHNNQNEHFLGPNNYCRESIRLIQQFFFFYFFIFLFSGEANIHCLWLGGKSIIYHFLRLTSLSYLVYLLYCYILFKDKKTPPKEMIRY